MCLCIFQSIKGIITTSECQISSQSLPDILALLIVVLQALFLDSPTEAAPALVVVLTVLVAHLAARFSAAVLPPLLEARVQVGTNDALVELGTADVLHAVEGVLVRVVLDEAEAAGRLGEAVEAHDEALDLAALGEELVDLLLSGVEGAVNITVSAEGGKVLLRLERIGVLTDYRHRGSLHLLGGRLEALASRCSRHHRDRVSACSALY